MKLGAHQKREPHTSWLLVVRYWGQRKLCGLLPFGHCDRPGNPRHRGTLSDCSCFLLRDMFDLGAEARRRRKWWSAIPTFSRFIWCHLSQGSPPPCGPPGTATWFALASSTARSRSHTESGCKASTIFTGVHYHCVAAANRFRLPVKAADVQRLGYSRGYGSAGSSRRAWER